jgi:hypothetical protein
MAQTHVSNAIRDCLLQCRSATDPTAQTAAFVADLRSAGWNEDDIRSVEVFVTQMLRTLGAIAEDPHNEAAADRRIP